MYIKKSAFASTSYVCQNSLPCSVSLQFPRSLGLRHSNFIQPYFKSHHRYLQQVNRFQAHERIIEFIHTSSKQSNYKKRYNSFQVMKKSSWSIAPCSLGQWDSISPNYPPAIPYLISFPYYRHHSFKILSLDGSTLSLKNTQTFLNDFTQVPQLEIFEKCRLIWPFNPLCKSCSLILLSLKVAIVAGGLILDNNLKTSGISIRNLPPSSTSNKTKLG